VDERDGTGLDDGSNAKYKELFKVDINGAVDVSNLDGMTAPPSWKVLPWPVT